MSRNTGKKKKGLSTNGQETDSADEYWDEEQDENRKHESFQEQPNQEQTPKQESAEYALNDEQEAGAAHPAPIEEVGVIDDIETLKKMLEEKNKIIDDYLNRIRYLQAEFDNYKKWTEKDKAEFTKVANERLIKSLLPVIDTLEKALESSKGEKNAFRDGVELILGELMHVLKGAGLIAMNTKGVKFDPFKHEAITAEIQDDAEDGTILDEFQKGYTLSDKVIRTAKVKIAKRPEKDTTADIKNSGQGSDEGNNPPKKNGQ